MNTYVMVMDVLYVNISFNIIFMTVSLQEFQNSRGNIKLSNNTLVK